MNATTIITKRDNGEYSTVIRGNVIETVFFYSDGSSKVVGRSTIILSEYANNHIDTFEER